MVVRFVKLGLYADYPLGYQTYHASSPATPYTAFFSVARALL